MPNIYSMMNVTGTPQAAMAPGIGMNGPPIFQRNPMEDPNEG